jgi:DNA repair protein RadC
MQVHGVAKKHEGLRPSLTQYVNKLNMAKRIKYDKGQLYKLALVKEPDTTGFNSMKLIDSEIAADYVRKLYGPDIDIFESMFMVALNNACQSIAWVKISQGGISSTACDVRLVCKYAIDVLASSIILVHNHPSGNFQPSKSDIEVTKQVKSALELFNIKLLDHLIITKINHFSIINNF